MQSVKSPVKKSPNFLIWWDRCELKLTTKIFVLLGTHYHITNGHCCKLNTEGIAMSYSDKITFHLNLLMRRANMFIFTINWNLPKVHTYKANTDVVLGKKEKTPSIKNPA